MRIKNEKDRELAKSLVSITMVCHEYLIPKERAEKVIETLEKSFVITKDEDAVKRLIQKYRVGGDQ